MAKVFISYSRKDIDFSRQLTERFENEGFDAWVDWQDIPPSVDWMNEIKQGIEEVDVFLYLVSPASVTSQICKNELDHAVLNGKRIIPVIVQDIEPAAVPAEISHLNWIFFSRPQDEFDAAFEKLSLAVKMDFDWVQVHKRLQIKALEWERNEHEGSFLLRGRDLEDARAQLTVNAGKQPLPTDIQKAYIEKSHQVEETLIEQQRAKEQELEVEKTIGVRSRRLTYILLAVFTLAFAVLYWWLYTLVAALSLIALKNQMITMIETSTVIIDGDRFQSLTNDYQAGARGPAHSPSTRPSGDRKREGEQLLAQTSSAPATKAAVRTLATWRVPSAMARLANLRLLIPPFSPERSPTENSPRCCNPARGGGGGVRGRRRGPRAGRREPGFRRRGGRGTAVPPPAGRPF